MTALAILAAVGATAHGVLAILAAGEGVAPIAAICGVCAVLCAAIVAHEATASLKARTAGNEADRRSKPK